MLLLSLLLVCGGSVRVVFSKSTSKITYDLEEAEALFEKFILDYDKQYEHKMEKQMRFEIFKTNLEKIKKMNMEDPVYGITSFADLLPEELKRYTGCSFNDEDRQKCPSGDLSDIRIGSAPDSFDWRDQNAVTRVRNQGHCGSCWAITTAGNVEGQYAIKHQELLELSSQELLDCSGAVDGCTGGYVTDAMNYLIKNGAELEKDYPYAEQKQDCQYNNNLKKVTVTDCKEFAVSDEDQLKEILYQYGPLAIGVHSNNDWYNYSGGVMRNCTPGDINHAILLVGYGSENATPFWILKNSWGENEGEKGYYRIIRGQNACNLLHGNIATTFVA